MRTGFPFSYLFVRRQMKVKSEQEILEFCRKMAAPLGITVPEIEFKQGKNPTLTVYIDKEGGVDLDTCEKYHNAILEPIDELDPTYGESYTLNVSSLGIDRPFKTDEDFLSHVGKMVEVRLKNSIRGKKFYDGILVSYDKKSVVIKVDEKTTFTVDMKNLEKMNEYIDFV